MMWLALWTLVVAPMAISGSGFEGCFSGEIDLDTSAAETYTFPDFNTNADCVQQCRQRGSILALTRGATCTCSLVFPAIQVGMPAHKNASGADTPCNTACTGSLVARSGGACQGDECCGGSWEGRPAYSVYATGGLSVIEQINARVHAALGNDELMKSLFRVKQSVTTCNTTFEEVKSKHGYFRLQLSRGQYTTLNNIMSTERCKQECLRQGTQCRSITYNQQTLKCFLNKVLSTDVPMVIQKQIAYVYDRRCKFRIQLPAQHFSLELINYKRVFNAEAPTSITPLDSHDFELDLTNSNFYDTIHRRVMMSKTIEATYSTESGFEENQSETQSSETTDRTSASHTEDSRESFSVGSTFSVGASVTAGFNVGFASGSATVETSLSLQTSAAFDSGKSDTSTKEKSQSQSESVTKGKSNFFNKGYTNTDRNENMKEYDFSMTVPPLHRGELRFTLQDERVTLKWRAHFMLNGYIKLRVVDYEAELHISKLLPFDARSFYSMGTISYDRSKVVGKTSIYDQTGRIVESTDQLVDQYK